MSHEAQTTPDTATEFHIARPHQIIRVSIAFEIRKKPRELNESSAGLASSDYSMVVEISLMVGFRSPLTVAAGRSVAFASPVSLSSTTLLPYFGFQG